MEIILIEEISELGYPGEILKVKDGYARNYLLPKKLAVRKTPKALEKLKEQMANFELKIKNRKLHYEDLKEKIDQLKEMDITVRASKEGKIYGSVTQEMIHSKLKEEHDIDIEKKKLVLRKTIKIIEDYEIDVILDKNTRTSFILHVSALEE